MRLTFRGLFRAAVAVAVVLLASPLFAQTPAERPDYLEVAVGASWNGGFSFGGADATETTGAGGAYRLFSVSNELAGTPAIDVRLSVPIARRFDAEAHGSFSRPELRSAITFDAETSNAPITATASIQQFTIGADVLWYPRATPRDARTRLFLAGGAGYLRQLEDRGTVIVTGAVIDAGGGIKMRLTSRTRGRLSGIGLRADARVDVHTHGIATDGRTHAAPSAGASVFLRF